MKNKELIYYTQDPFKPDKKNLKKITVKLPKRMLSFMEEWLPCEEVGIKNQSEFLQFCFHLFNGWIADQVNALQDQYGLSVDELCEMKGIIFPSNGEDTEA